MDPRKGLDYDYMSRAVLACPTQELAKEFIDLGLAYPDCKRDHELTTFCKPLFGKVISYIQIKQLCCIYHNHFIHRDNWKKITSS